MNPILESGLVENRRHFFSRSATGIGTAALASLLNPDLFAGLAAPAATTGHGGLPDLPQIARACSAASRLSCFLDGRKKKSGQQSHHAQDGNDFENRHPGPALAGRSRQLF